MNILELSREDRFEYLKKNSKALITLKKASIKTADCVVSNPMLIKSEGADKAAGEEGAYEIAANTCMYIDDQMDALAPGAATKSINENLKRGTIYFLKNHARTTDSIIGRLKDAYYKQFPLSSLGYDAEGMADVLTIVGEPDEELDAKTYGLYKKGFVKQHSISLQYVKIDLAVDDPTNAQGYKTWQAHYDEIINKDVADRYGFFFYVSEFKLFELSAVLWGSNDLTGIIEPGKTTQEDSRKSTIDKSEFQTIFSNQLKQLWTKTN